MNGTLFDGYDFSPLTERVREGSVSKAMWDLLGKTRLGLKVGVVALQRHAKWELATKPTTMPDGTVLGRASLLTWTTKMVCASFSLPAGTPASGGTCAAASVKAKGAPVNAVYICDRCYAGKNNYLYYHVAFTQAVRLAWVNQVLNELGVWALALYLATAIKDDAEGEYFRIHDAGDFHREDYYKTWVEVARQLPNVKFWAPTRQWVFPKWREIFKATPPPANLVLRPSALLFGEKPPDVEGMSAGSTSADAAPDGVSECPAYASDEHSCVSAGCRACWESPQTSVSYKAH